MFSNIHLFLWSSNTLQVGSVIRTTVFIISALTLMANLFDYKLNPRYSWPIDIFLITVVVALMVIAGVRTVMTAYHESRKLCWVSFCFISMFSIIGLYLLALLSFFNQHTDESVLKTRCGASFWLAGLSYTLKDEDIFTTVKKRLGVLMTTLMTQSSHQQISIGYINISQSINH